ncbi:MAG: glycosyltransferase family 4 protein [Rhodospirillales bacterium]|nr:glycosyltransferase family 4 protein [Rhodospirillales bacterium]
MRRPSILFINRVYPPVRGASGRVLRDLARSFAREGWQVTVITTGPKSLSERDGAVRVIRVKGPDRPANVLGYLWVWLKLLIEALRLPKTHLVVTLTDPPFLVVAGRIVTALKRNRHIHWCQDVYPDVLPALGVNVPEFLMGFLKARVRGAMKRADKVIVIGRCMARHFSYDGFDPKQITVIPNWADAELVQPVAHEGDDFPVPLPESYRAHEDQHKQGPKFRVLYAGNLGRGHPVETILQAAEILNETHRDIEFVFVGDGPRHEMINRERTRRHLENIRLLPYQPASRLKDLMESGDVHLVTMDEQAAGMMVPVKLYSAIAAHRPCIFIGPTQSETAKIIQDFKTGMVCAQGNAQGLAEQIRQYREDRDKWFVDYEGAKAASAVFVPQESINAWVERAWAVVDQDVQE